MNKSDNAWYGMTPIGGLMWDDSELRLGLYSFDWYSKDGRTDYLTKALLDLSAIRAFNILFTPVLANQVSTLAISKVSGAYSSGASVSTLGFKSLGHLERLPLLFLCSFTSTSVTLTLLPFSPSFVLLLHPNQ